jgi:hypothetical protein
LRLQLPHVGGRTCAYTSTARVTTAQARKVRRAKGSGISQGMASVSDERGPPFRPRPKNQPDGGVRRRARPPRWSADYNAFVGWIAIGLLVATVLILLGAEWPRLSRRVGADAWAERSRRRRKEKLTLIRGDEAEDDDFVKSVERDLADLPVFDEHEDRPRR